MTSVFGASDQSEITSCKLILIVHHKHHTVDYEIEFLADRIRSRNTHLLQCWVSLSVCLSSSV